MALLDTMRTPSEAQGDAIIPSENTDGSWTAWDAEWECEIGRYEGEGAERMAKAKAIETIVERYGEYDGWDGWKQEGENTEIEDRIAYLANGIPC